MRTLRGRLILSHTLPVLLLVPLLGLTIFYLLQAQRQLTFLSGELSQQAQMVAQSAQNRPGIWSDADTAELFIVEVISDELQPDRRINVMLLRPEGQLLAASDPQESELVGQRLDVPEMQVVLSQEKGYLRVQARVANIVVPVVNAEQQVVGLVSLTQELDAVTARILQLRFLLVGALVVELLLAVGVGLVLALRFERDVQTVTLAVRGISSGRPLQPLPETNHRGTPAEFRDLLHAYNTLVKRLQSLEEARRQLLANTVHELARPLGAMRSAIQALLYGADEDPKFRQELLHGMDAQVERLQPLLDNLAELHGQVLGTLELALRPVSVAEWLRQIAVPWQAAAQEKGVHWQITVSETLPTLTIDPDRLAQAVGNLLSNAVKYTPPGGLVSLSAAEAKTADGAVVAITICDTGPGIPPEEQEEIFTPFYRSRRDTRFPQGMGLGLTIARDLVWAHGGRLELKSVPGEGSTFTVYLPLTSTLN